MKLAQLASKPQLIKVEINDSEIVESYGEAIEFYIYDRQNMETYVKLSQLEGADVATIAGTVIELVLDENGDAMLNEQELLPIDVMVKVIEAVAGRLETQ